MGEELEIKLLSLQKKHKKPSWIWVTSFPLFLCTQTAQIHIFQRPNKTSDNVNIGHNVPASELTLWAAKGSFQRGNNEGRGIDSASSESSLPRKAFPVSSCSLVNEYELLTEGWPHRWSGKQSHFKPVACNSPQPEGGGWGKRQPFLLSSPSQSLRLRWVFGSRFFPPTGWGKSWNKDNGAQLVLSS